MTQHIDDSSNVEDLVRAAQQHQAERAVAPEQIRAALPARAARRARQRRNGALGVAGVAVAVALAVTAPLLAVRHPGPAATPGLRAGAAQSAVSSGSAGASTPSHASALTIAPIALGYHPTWLPGGLEERIRRAPLGDAVRQPYAGVSRTWTRSAVGTDDDGGRTALTLTVRAALGADDPQANEGTRVDVNGAKGFYHGRDGEVKSYVEWRVDADTVLSLDQLRIGLSEQTMLKIARAVRPDPATMRLPLRLGWLPAGLSLDFATFGGDSGTAWYAQLHMGPASGSSAEPTPGDTVKQGSQSISVMLSPTTTAPAGGKTLSVGGHPARLVTRTDLPALNMRYLVVTLGGGKLLTLIGDWPTADQVAVDDLVRIAQHATLDRAANVSWIGR